MIDITLKINKKDLQALEKAPKKYREGLSKGMRKAMFMVERAAKRRFGKPGELQVRTGHLRRSIKSGVKEYRHKLIGSIGSDLVYSRIHELGGVIRPRKGEYLRFPIDGSWRTVKQVKIPKRPYLRPSIEENMEEIKDILVNSIVKEVD